MRDDGLSSTERGKAKRDAGAPVTLADEILSEDQSHYDQVDPGMLAALEGRVMRDTVDHDGGVVETLRQLSTTARVTFGMLLAMACGAAFLLAAGVRPDLDVATALWLGGLHVLVIVAALVGVSMALRPTHRGTLGATAWVGVGVLFLLPFMLSAVPGLWPGMVEPVPNDVHLMCGGMGAVVAIPATALVLLFDRSGNPAAWRVLLAAAAAGLTSFAWGQWQCPSANPTHLLVAHAGAGLVAGGVVLAVSTLANLLRR